MLAQKSVQDIVNSASLINSQGVLKKKALKEFEFSPIEAVSAAEPKTLTAEISLTSYEGRYVKAFIVDENMKLLRNDFAYLGEQEAQKTVYKTRVLL